MAVFPENMNRLDTGDTKGSLSTIENYIRYMVERIEFSTRNTTRTVTEAGVSSVGLYNDVKDLENVVVALGVTAAQNRTSISQLQGNVTSLQEQITAVKNRMDEMEPKVTASSGSIVSILSSMSVLESEIQDLVKRVDDLENGGPPV